MTFTFPKDYTHQKAPLLSTKEHIDREILKEEQIVEASKKDIGQFEYLYNKYYEPVFRYVYHRVGDEEETADVVSRVFMNAMNAIGKYECRGLPFGAWLFRIAANEVKKQYRSAKSPVLCLEEEKLNSLWVCGEVSDDEERINILGKLISYLNDEEVTILQLKYFEDKNFKEIALMLDKKESAVKMRMYRALNKLKELYDKLEGEGR